MLNPTNMTRLADLLVQGAIMKQIIQPYESHLQYLLQWMCDFNLYGCAYIECTKYMFRDPVPSASTAESLGHRWHDASIRQDWISSSDEHPRLSHCSLELDICVQDIMNRNEVVVRDLHADFAEHFQQNNPEEKLVRSLASLWVDETKRRKRRIGLPDDSSSPFPADVLVSISADSRDSSKGGWIHENEYRDKVRALVTNEGSKASQPHLSFHDFDVKDSTYDKVQTALESVEDLFPEKLQSTGSTSKDFNDSQDVGESDEPLVDETTISQSNDTMFAHDSDEGTAKEIAVSQKPAQSSQSGKNRPTSLEVMDEPDKLDGTSDTTAKQDQSGTTPERIDMQKGTLNLTKRPPPHSSQSPQKSSNEGGTTKRQKVRIAHNVSSAEESPQGGIPGVRSPKSSQTLSQSKFNAGGQDARQNFSYPVFKTPHSSQQSCHDGNLTARSTPSSKLFESAKAKTQGQIPTTVTPDRFRNISSQASAFRDEHSSSSVRRFDKSYRSYSAARRSVFRMSKWPPSAKHVGESMLEHRLYPVVYQDAHYSKDSDVPERPRGYAGREFSLKGISTQYLPPFNANNSKGAMHNNQLRSVINDHRQGPAHRKLRQNCKLRNWEYAKPPPTWHEVQRWVEREQTSFQNYNKEGDNAKLPDLPNRDTNRQVGLSQVEGPTQKNSHGFKYSQKRAATSVKHETQYMSIMSLEVHVNTRHNLAPNPEEDEVSCIVWCIQGDDGGLNSEDGHRAPLSGLLFNSDDGAIASKMAKELGVDVEWWPNELDLMNRMVDIVREHDPDILTGFEVHNSSWGYLIERSRVKYEYDLCDELSRVMSQSHGRFGKEADKWGFNTTSTIRVTGRHMINVWRAMRGELNLLQYTLENIAFHLLHKRVPHYPFHVLTAWYTSDKARDIWKCVDYFLSRARMNLEILDASELVPRTSEQARLIGVDFFSVFSRGSQFKVESFMFRIAKPENFLLVSPSRKQVGQQNALECLPLVMEPQSDFYTSPLLVLDFQSLYPSIMIAYNYCYSTCLGRVVDWRGKNKLGFTDFERQPGILGLVQDSINIAPNGMMYVRPDMRKSLLAKMLGEILETRFMVKSGMKEDKDDRALQKLLNNRQLALKLLANVTYGYTSASFSGRMPCAEIADSIVQTGRETLEKAIALIHSIDRWGAEVVYGDTDSLFVYLKGRSRHEAFDIGNEIAAAVTKMNPRPIKLKFEKVYHPCVLLAKKRYVGFKYESKDQTEPEFDAKGIETVRRDGTPAEQKIEEKALKILFRTADLSQVKQYFQRQCAKIITGKVSIQDFCFAREVKLGTYADKGPPPPGALISARRMLADPRTEPQYGERVPYVVVTGAPGARLIDRCVAPESLLHDDSATLDADYYITKNIIPPLERIFNLVGANVKHWYDEMPKVQRIRPITFDAHLHPNGPLRKTLEGYMTTSHCLICRRKITLPSSKSRRRPASSNNKTPICSACLADPATALYTLSMRRRDAEKENKNINDVCRSCAGLAFAEDVKCDSKDCAVFYSRVRSDGKVRRERGVLEQAGSVLEDVDAGVVGRRRGRRRGR